MNSNTIPLANQLSRSIHSEIQNNPKTLAFSFVVNQEDNTAEIITTNKFTTLLNQELIRQLTQIVTACVEQPQTVKEAEEKFKVYKINLPPPIEVNTHSMRMDEEMPMNHMRVFTPSGRRMTPIARLSPRNIPNARNSPRMSPCTPIGHGYAQLEPEMIAPKMHIPPTSPTRRCGTTTPHGNRGFHQNMDGNLDDSMKYKFSNVLGKNNSEE